MHGHGKRRTNADKRKAVMTLLEDEEWSGFSNDWIAEKAAVSIRTVERYRAAITTDNVGSQRQPLGSGKRRPPMRTIILAAALFLCGAVEASCNLSSVRLDAGLVKVGDSDRRVIQSEPDRVVQLENRAGWCRKRKRPRAEARGLILSCPTMSNREARV